MQQLIYKQRCFRNIYKYNFISFNHWHQASTKKSQINVMGCLHCPIPIPMLIPRLILIICRKATFGLILIVFPMQSSKKITLKHLIGIDIGVKLGTVPICIGIGISPGIGIGPLYTLLKKTIIPNSIAIGLRISIGIGVRQCKHTISPKDRSVRNRVNACLFYQSSWHCLS